MSEMAAREAWTRVAFGGVVRLSKEQSRDPQADGLARYVGLEHIEPGSLKIRSWGDTADGTTFTTVFRPGQVLFGKRRSYQRKVAVADFSGVCSSDIYVLEPKGEELLLELLPFICQTDAFFEHAVGTSAGSLSPRTNWHSLATFEFALPPLKEQRRIAEVLRASESVTQAARRSEEAMRRALVVARHHLMSRYSPDTHSAEARAGDVLRRCSLMTLADLVEPEHGIVDGPFGSNLKSEHYRDAGYPVLQSAFIARGAFDPDASDWVYVDESKFREQYRSAVRPGDIAMVKVGVNCGACDVVPEDQPTAILAGNCLKISPNATVCDTHFLLHYLKWLYEVGLLERHVTSTQQRALTLGRLKGQKVLLPPISEQKSVAAVLDACRRGVAVLRVRRAEAERLADGVLLGLIQ